MTPLDLLLVFVGVGLFTVICATCMPGKVTAILETLVGAGFFAAGLWALQGDETYTLTIQGVIGNAQLSLDALSASFLLPIGLISATGAVYALRYWADADHPENHRLVRGGHMMLALAMALVVVVQSGLAFLVAWELMALSGFFLIAAEHHEAENRKAALIYLVATHLSTLFIWSMFAFILADTGFFGFAPLKGEHTQLILILGLIGFGLKAGVFPGHVWLPGAHAAAPSHVSALLSGVLLKMGIYGIARLLVLSEPSASFAMALTILGAVSAFCGVAFALGQHDYKRLLAWHSIENVGIILLGLGLGTMGRACGLPSIALLGYAGALLHIWNHAIFKSLLFYCAGAVLQACKTRQIDRLGGLVKQMRHTMFWFTIGAAAICGLPPLNGFVSELWIYLGLFESALNESTLKLAFMAPVLAMVGALAIACFVKVLGAVFLGQPRSEDAAKAVEPPMCMRSMMGLLGVLCILLGVLPGAVLPYIEKGVLILCPAVGDLSLQSQFQGVGTTYVSIGLVILMGCFYMMNRHKCIRSKRHQTWGCGYQGITPRMQYTATSFASNLVHQFAPVLRPKRTQITLKGLYPETERYEEHVEDVVLEGLLLPRIRQAARMLGRLRALQSGRTQLYILYIGLAVLALLAWLWFSGEMSSVPSALGGAL